MRRILLNLSSREIQSSGQNACLAAGFRPDLLREVRRFPDLIFRPQNHKNFWQPGSARTRWGSLSAPPGPLAQWVPWKETFKPQYGRFAARKGVESTLDEAQMNEKGYFEIYHRERFSLQVKMHVWRPGFARTC